VEEIELPIGAPNGCFGWGDNLRIVLANVLRVELTLDGNFGSKLWIFTQALEGTPDRRDDYPAIRDIKLPPGSPTHHLHRNPNEGRAPDSEDLDPSLWKK
jgi:hypothetical protein